MSVLGNMLVQKLKTQIHTEEASLCCESMIRFSFNKRKKELAEKTYFVLTEFSLSLCQTLKLKSLDLFIVKANKLILLSFLTSSFSFLFSLFPFLLPSLKDSLEDNILVSKQLTSTLQQQQYNSRDLKKQVGETASLTFQRKNTGNL